MFRLFGFVVKSACLVVLVLAAGSLIELKGRTLSEHVETGLEDMKIDSWVHSTARKIGIFTREQAKRFPARTESAPKAAARKKKEDIPQSERQKLRALIHELNNSTLSAHR